MTASTRVRLCEMQRDLVTSVTSYISSVKNVGLSLCVCIVMFANDNKLCAHIYKPRLGRRIATSAYSRAALYGSVVISCTTMCNT